MVTSKKIHLDRVRFREPIARGLPFFKMISPDPPFGTLTPGSALFQLGGLPVLASPGCRIVDLGDGGRNDSMIKLPSLLAGLSLAGAFSTMVTHLRGATVLSVAGVGDTETT